MTIIYKQKEIYLDNPSLEELVASVCSIREQPQFDDFKIIINGTDENTDTEGELYLPK